MKSKTISYSVIYRNVYEFFQGDYFLYLTLVIFFDVL